jgi:hypothetical protein
MPKDSEQPASWRAFTKPPPSRRAQPEEPVALDFGPEHKISSNASPLSLPISPPMAALAPLALQKLHRICLAEVRTLKARYTLATVKLAPLQVPQRDPRRGPRSLGLAPKKNALRSALQLSRARTGRNPRAGTPPITSAFTTTQAAFLSPGKSSKKCSTRPFITKR